MSHLITAPLFFFLGALVSWLFFAWKGDRDESELIKWYKSFKIRDAEIISALMLKIYNLQKQQEKQNG